MKVFWTDGGSPCVISFLEHRTGPGVKTQTRLQGRSACLSHSFSQQTTLPSPQQVFSKKIVFQESLREGWKPNHSTSVRCSLWAPFAVKTCYPDCCQEKNKQEQKNAVFLFFLFALVNICCCIVYNNIVSVIHCGGGVQTLVCSLYLEQLIL